MNLNRSRRSVRPWYIILLAGVAAAVIAIGITELGTPTSSARTSKETVTAANGVVQTTVSGSGNVIAFNLEGVVLTGSSTVGDSILENSIFQNLGAGIDLGIPPGNDGLAAPVLTGADTLHRYPAAGLPFQLVNNYGPTECAVVATSGIVNPASDVQKPAIGSAIANTQRYWFCSCRFTQLRIAPT